MHWYCGVRFILNAIFFPKSSKNINNLFEKNMYIYFTFINTTDITNSISSSNFDIIISQLIKLTYTKIYTQHTFYARYTLVRLNELRETWVIVLYQRYCTSKEICVFVKKFILLSVRLISFGCNCFEMNIFFPLSLPSTCNIKYSCRIRFIE